MKVNILSINPLLKSTRQLQLLFPMRGLLFNSKDVDVWHRMPNVVVTLSPLLTRIDSKNPYTLRASIAWHPCGIVFSYSFRKYRPRSG